MDKKSNSYILRALPLFLISLIFLFFISGCINEEPIQRNKMVNVPINEEYNKTIEVNEDVYENSSYDINKDGELSDDANKSGLNESDLEEVDENLSCITEYQMGYFDENGVYRSTEIKFSDKNYSISISGTESFIDISFNPRINTVNPDEERYSHATGYYRRLPNDESICLNPELIFEGYSVAVCNVTSFKQEFKTSPNYQGEILVYNHSVKGCIENYSSERRVWLSGCKEGSTSLTCNLQAFSEEQIIVTANQKYKDEIKSVNIKINEGDVLPSYDMFQTEYFATFSFKIATDSLYERLYKVDIELTLKNGLKEKYVRQIRIISPPHLSDYEFDDDCFTFTTLRVDSEKSMKYLGSVTLREIFRNPQMVYLEVGSSNRIWALGYGSERSAREDYKVTSVDFEREEITLRSYDSFCNGLSE